MRWSRQMREFQIRTSYRPRPLPTGRWAATERWNDLLFAHWPIPVGQMADLLPPGLEPDLFQGTAWLGIVPFWLDRIRLHGLPYLSFGRHCPDLNLRTYVREPHTKTAGVYCFSIDARSLLAVTVARLGYQLPYYWAEMSMEQRGEHEFSFFSRRRMAHNPIVAFHARYRGLGPNGRQAESIAGSFESYMTDRGCLYSMTHVGQLQRASLHTVAWPLEEAEAEIEYNSLAASIGLTLPPTQPILHYSRRLAVYVWPAELVRPALARRPVTVAVSPSG
jgi:uncharacterized protein YqjF (DUF2071 family)